jgi:hypothetical protein
MKRKFSSGIGSGDSDSGSGSGSGEQVGKDLIDPLTEVAKLLSFSDRRNFSLVSKNFHLAEQAAPSVYTIYSEAEFLEMLEFVKSPHYANRNIIFDILYPFLTKDDLKKLNSVEKIGKLFYRYTVDAELGKCLNWSKVHTLLCHTFENIEDLTGINVKEIITDVKPATIQTRGLFPESFRRPDLFVFRKYYTDLQFQTNFFKENYPYIKSVAGLEMTRNDMDVNFFLDMGIKATCLSLTNCQNQEYTKLFSGPGRISSDTTLIDCSFQLDETYYSKLEFLKWKSDPQVVFTESVHIDDLVLSNCNFSQMFLKPSTCTRLLLQSKDKVADFSKNLEITKEVTIHHEQNIQIRNCKCPVINV